MLQGFQRVFDDLPDICIDVPLVYSLIERFANKALAAEIITKELVLEVPIRYCLQHHTSLVVFL